MAIAFVNQAAGTSFSTSRNQTITSTTSGNTLIVVLLHQSSGTASVSDNQGGTWTLAGDSADAGATSQYKIGIWYQIGVPAGITSVTVSASPSSALAVNVSEWSGITGFGSVNSKYDATTGTTSGAAAVTASTNELVIGGTAYFKSADGVSTSTYTSLTSTGTSTTREGSAYWIATSSGSTAPDFSYNTPGANNVGSVTARFVGSINYTQDPADDEDITDSRTLVQAVVRSAGDSAGVTDSGADVLDAVRSPADPAGATDAAATVRTVQTAPTDAEGVTDAVAKVVPDPTGLTVNVSGTNVTLTWTASSAPGLIDYSVRRRAGTSGAPLDVSHEIARTASTTYQDNGVPSGDYEYQVYGVVSTP